MKYQINIEITKEIVKKVMADASRKQTLEKALLRNYTLTTVYDLESVILEVYKEGYYLILSGTRCEYKVYAKDNDGELELTRKPNKDKLHLLYKDSGKSWYIGLDDMWR